MPWDDWIRTNEIEPSLYAADFSQLGRQVEILLGAGARVFHFDVGDGRFVPPITVGPIVLQWISPLVHRRGGALDCHLMVEEPARHFAAIAEAGGDSVTFHLEAVDDVGATVRAARDEGLEVGLAFNPETAPAEAAAAADGVDLVLCMSIRPGYSGQAFMPAAIDRVGELRSLLPESVHVQVDGGVGHDNVRALADAGADLLVAGTAIFEREDLPRAYDRLARALL
ncbi:MAG: ribulose-phosphate 3-epimerase [Gaiellaceae bacterium]